MKIVAKYLQKTQKSSLFTCAKHVFIFFTRKFPMKWRKKIPFFCFVRTNEICFYSVRKFVFYKSFPIFVHNLIKNEFVWISRFQNKSFYKFESRCTEKHATDSKLIHLDIPSKTLSLKEHESFRATCGLHLHNPTKINSQNEKLLFLHKTPIQIKSILEMHESESTTFFIHSRCMKSVSRIYL
jgi:hypothetical protein